MCSLLSRWISSLAHLIYNTLPPEHKTLTLISHAVCARRQFRQRKKKKKSTKKTQPWVKKYLNPSLYFSLFMSYLLRFGFDNGAIEMGVWLCEQVRFTDRWHVPERWEVRHQRWLSKTRRRSHVAVPTSACSTIAASSPPVCLSLSLTFFKDLS